MKFNGNIEKIHMIYKGKYFVRLLELVLRCREIQVE